MINVLKSSEIDHEVPRPCGYTYHTTPASTAQGTTWKGEVERL